MGNDPLCCTFSIFSCQAPACVLLFRIQQKQSAQLKTLKKEGSLQQACLITMKALFTHFCPSSPSLPLSPLSHPPNINWPHSCISLHDAMQRLCPEWVSQGAAWLMRLLFGELWRANIHCCRLVVHLLTNCPFVCGMAVSRAFPPYLSRQTLLLSQCASAWLPAWTGLLLH